MTTSMYTKYDGNPLPITFKLANDQMNEQKATEQLVVFRTALPRPVQQNGLIRRVYFAFDAQSEEKQLAAFVVVSECGYGNYVEWIHVHEDRRREGIATRVLRCIEERASELVLTGTTPEGKTFTEYYLGQFPRRNSIDEYRSSVLLETEDYHLFKIQAEEPGMPFDIIQAYSDIESSNGPDCIIVFDQRQRGRVQSIYNSGVDLEGDRPEWMDAVENEYGKLDLSNANAFM